MKTIIELKALRESATPGPWVARHEEYDSHEVMTEDTGKAYTRGGHVLHYLVAGDKLFPAFTGNGPTSKANAEYIAALHDAAPLMFSACRALQAISDSVPCRGDKGGDCAYCGAVAAMDVIEKHEDDCPWRIARVALADPAACVCHRDPDAYATDAPNKLLR